jgi:hypothetical protein
MATFRAKYRGQCAEGDSISEGDEVMYDSSGKLVHVDCKADDLVARGPICPSCHLEHKGECW